MKPWIVDANFLPVEDLDEFRRNLLQSNIRIADFLDDSNKSHLLIVAPKGFGKTLLLKAKRLKIAERISRLIPHGHALVDKPGGAVSTMTHKDYGQTRNTDAYWKIVWLLALVIAIRKTRDDKIPECSRTARSLLVGDQLNPCDIFNYILALTAKEYHALVRDYNFLFLPHFRMLHDPISVFIDNVDEFFDEQMKDAIDNRDWERLEILRSYWHRSQTGLALAARELNAINNHIKLYVSIRKEVFQRALLGSPLGLQLSGSAMLIEYSKDDIEQIIEKNILIERRSNLVSPDASTPFEKFFGPANTVLWHSGTGDEEAIEDYWIRHTLRRPRDVMRIGALLSSTPTASRTPEVVKSTINKAASQIAVGYLSEMRPHLTRFDHSILFSLIEKNVLSANELSAIAARYDECFFEQHPDAGAGPCQALLSLFKIGLLGYVAPHPETLEPTQVFQFPGDVPLDVEGILPKSDYYLVHPMLDDLIASYNPTYYRNMNKNNIVGADRRWREERQSHFVIIGDVVNYSSIMADADRSAPFDRAIRKILDRHCSSITYKAVEGGDTVVLCDENPVHVVTAAQAIARSLNEEFDVKLRFAGDAGFLEFIDDGKERAPRGIALRVASRLQPHVAPGCIYVTEGFRDEVVRFGVRRWRMDAIHDDQLPGLQEENGKFNISKNGQEGALWRGIYKLETSRRRTERVQTERQTEARVPGRVRSP